MTKLLAHHWLTVGVLVVGIALTGAFGWWSHTNARERADLLVERQARLVAETISAAVGDTLKDAAAAAGLLEASEDVTEDEWRRFAEKIGHHPGSLGLAYLPVVPAADLPAYLAEARASHPSYELFRWDSGGNRTSPRQANTYSPVRYFAPAPGSSLDLRGLTAHTEQAWSEALEAATRGRPVVSRLGQLPPVPSDLGYVAVAPVTEGSEVAGFTAVMVRLDRLVSAELAESLAPLVTWNITDVTRPISVPASPDPFLRTEVIEVGGRAWRVEVRPTPAARADLVASPLRATVTVGLLLSVLAALVAHLGSHALRRAREAAELRRMTREKDEFLAAVSHELRTPLTVVVGMAEILTDALEDPGAEVAEYLGMLRSEAGELARLVEDLLLMGRLETDTLALDLSTVDVRWETERVLGELDPPEDTEVRLGGEGEAWADSLRLRQILRNLLGNALRHGGEEVAVRIEEDASEVRVRVTDDGPGVPAEQASHLFSASLGAKGTPGGPATLGLGLRISARLALALGGGLEYRREEEQTVFELRLPRPPSRSGAPERTPGDDLLAGRHDRSDISA